MRIPLCSFLSKPPFVLFLFLGMLHAQQPTVVPVVAPTSVEQLSKHPSLPEPLMPITEAPPADETAALAAAVAAWDSRTTGDDFRALEGFVASHPQSAWAPAVNLNLGLLYYRGGYFSRSIAAFSTAWQSARVGAAPASETLANRAVAELAVMHARVGHMDDLAALLEEVKARKFQGYSQIQMERACGGLRGMGDRPEISFRCGPYALGTVAKKEGLSVPESFREQTPSSPQGFSMKQLKEVAAEKLGMQVQVVKRPVGGRVPIPSVMHFKCLHFGAVVTEAGGHYQIVDPTFGNDTWMSKAAVDDEASGYFLVPARELPEGFSAVTDDVAAELFGRGNSTETEEGATKCGDKQTSPGCKTGAGMAYYSIHLMRASLSVTDTPIVLPGAFGDSIALTCAYHQREATQLNTQLFTHFGSQWVSNMVSSLEENTFIPTATVTVFLPGGGYDKFTGYNSDTKLYARSYTTGMQLYRAEAGSYELRMQDGSKYVYSRTTGSGTRRVFLTAMVDSWGSQTTFSYDTTGTYPFRISSITTPSGRTLHFFYSSGNPYAVSDVADKAVLAEAYKKVHFTYETTSGNTQRLISITDPVGIQSAFSYDATGTMTSLKTPYGTTIFNSSPVNAITQNRWISATDPQGDTEKVMARVAPLPPPANVPENVVAATSWLTYRNVFHWTKVMYKVGADDITKAHAYHWLHDPLRGEAVTGILECEKPPLQDYIWYNYPGQPEGYTAGSAPTPSAVGSVVETANGTGTSGFSMSYHERSGNLAEQVGSSGLRVHYTYESVPGADTVNPGTDVTAVRIFDPTPGAGWITVRNITQYHNHMPIEYTDEQNILTTVTPNDKGQATQVVRSSTVAGVTRTETMRATYTEGPDDVVPEVWSPTSFGYLRKMEVSHPATPGAFVTVAQYIYDEDGRQVTQTDAENYTLTYAYDALDRITQISYPDTSAVAIEYMQDGQAILSPTKITGRDGRVVRHRYNSLGQRSATIDARQQPTFFEWCLCGDIKKLIDAKGQVTTWRHDIQGRVTAKISPNGDTTSYEFYPSSGWVKSVTFPNDQGSGHPTYTLTYNAQGRVVKQDYTDANTADVTLDEFDFLGRLTRMTDGLGISNYAYHPFGVPGAGRASVEDGPLIHDALRYHYTHFGRLQRTENVSEPVNESSAVRQFVGQAYDLLGRPLGITTDMGYSSLEYLSDNHTDRVDSITHQIGGADAVRSSFGYYPATDAVNRGRLQNITHAFPAGGGTWAPQVQHDYGYDMGGRIASWRWRSLSFDTHPAIDRRWQAMHDATDQLESVVSSSCESTTALDQWSYAYDPAGNRTYEENSGAGIISKHSEANRLLQRGGAGSVRVSGTVDKAASVTVNGQPARVTSAFGGSPYRFEKDLVVGTGTQTFTVAAADGGTPPQTTTRSYSIDVPAVSQVYEYDANGNLTKVRNGQTQALERSYEWDAANKLVKILYADNGSTEFQYDGMSQRRVITEKDAGGAVMSVTRFLWKNGRVWQEQDASGRMTKRYHINGVQVLSYVGTGTIPTNVASSLTLHDHLESQREVVTLVAGAPAITGRRDFDPYGKAEHVGQVPTNAAFTSHYLHQRSGLTLALYRAYDAQIGRWISEDPIGEGGGPNLYSYVGSSVMQTDPLGLSAMDLVEGAWSYVRGNYRGFRNIARQVGALGDEQYEQAKTERTLVGQGVCKYLNDPKFAELVNKAAFKGAANFVLHKSGGFVIGRLGAGSYVTYQLSSAFGPKGFVAGVGLGLNALHGDAWNALEDQLSVLRAANIPEETIRCINPTAEMVAGWLQGGITGQSSPESGGPTH